MHVAVSFGLKYGSQSVAEVFKCESLLVWKCGNMEVRNFGDRTEWWTNHSEVQ